MANENDRMTRAAVVSCGDELTSGQTVDTNSAWLSQRLAELGVRVVRHVTVGDDAAATADAIRQCAVLARWVIVTGGLGPTPDDLMRDAAAILLGEKLALRTEALAQIEAWFARANRAMVKTNLVQAMFPPSAEVLANDCGTAPGLRFAFADSIVFCLPGVPVEMRAMFAASVAPAVREQLTTGPRLAVRTVHTFGIGESDLAARLGDLLARDRNPQLGTTAGSGSVSVRIYARADSAEQTRTMLDSAERAVLAVLGPALCFGRDDDTLESVIGRLLRARGQTLALAESCTGGLLGQLVTSVPGSGDYFIESIVSYANQAKLCRLGVRPETLAQFGAVSEQTAAEMAVGVRKSSGADWGVSITGVAGPGGGTTEKPVGLVCIGLCGPGGERVHRLLMPGDREMIRLRAARMALNHLRLALLEINA